MASIKGVLDSFNRSIVQKAKAVSPFRTGRLRNSIKGVVKNYVVFISMRLYGFILDRGGFKHTKKHKGWFKTVLRPNVDKVRKELIDSFKTEITTHVKKTKGTKLSRVRPKV